MRIRPTNLLRFVTPPGLRRKKVTAHFAEAGVPMLFEEEAPRMSFAMVFTSPTAVLFFPIEPAACSALLLATLAIALYTTLKPEVKTWDLYKSAMRKPLEERIEMLRAACEAAPARGAVREQATFALGCSLASAGEHAEALKVLIPLSERHPFQSAIESAMSTAYRALLARSTELRLPNAVAMG